MCAKCPDEPLLDSRETATELFLIDTVSDRHYKHELFVSSVAMIPALVIAGGTFGGIAWIAWVTDNFEILANLFESEAACSLLLIPTAVVYIAMREMVERIWPRPGNKPWL